MYGNTACAAPQYGGQPIGNDQYDTAQFGQPSALPLYGQQLPQYVQPPQYFQPPSPPLSAGPTVIRIENEAKSGNQTFCPVCVRKTQTYPKKVLGAGNFLWCLICFAIVGPFSILAICMDTFNDVEMRCARCGYK